MSKTESAAEAVGGHGRAVVLPNGEKRIEWIRDQFYNNGLTRSEILKQVNAMYVDAGREGEQIVYQIVFGATKDPDTDPRIASAENKAKAAEAKVKREEEAAAAKAEAKAAREAAKAEKAKAKAEAAEAAAKAKTKAEAEAKAKAKKAK